MLQLKRNIKQFGSSMISFHMCENKDIQLSKQCVTDDQCPDNSNYQGNDLSDFFSMKLNILLQNTYDYHKIYTYT